MPGHTGAEGYRPGVHARNAGAPRRRFQGLVVGAVSLVFITVGGVALAQGPAAPPPDTVSCGIIVPPHPLTAAGLATPYRLVAPCRETDDSTAAFVQATIVDPATGNVSVYDPLVIDENSKPAAAPATPKKLPKGAVVGIWFGFNGDNLTLQGAGGSLDEGMCVNGLGDSIFGQFAFCNAPAFFTAANEAIARGKLDVPAEGTARDGQPCLTTRDFGLVDMDQSDNVTTSYLALPDGRTAQNTAANETALSPKGAQIEINGSDNALLNSFVDPALGCAPFTAPDLADPGHLATSLALNELQAAAHQSPPAALIPTNDPMVLIGSSASVAKTNLYRAGVDQPVIDPAVETPTAYCQNLVAVGVARTKLDKKFTLRMVSPAPDEADTLFSFLAQRLAGTFDVLGCADLLHIANPVHVQTGKNGVAVGATFSRTAPPPSGASPSEPAPSSEPASADPSSSDPSSSGPSSGPSSADPSDPVSPRPSVDPAPSLAPPATTNAPKGTAPTSTATTEGGSGGDANGAPVIRPTDSGGSDSGGAGSGGGDSGGAGSGGSGSTGYGSGGSADSGSTTVKGSGDDPGPSASAQDGGNPISVLPVQAKVPGRSNAAQNGGLQTHSLVGFVLIGGGIAFVAGIIGYGLWRRRRTTYGF